MKKLVLAVLGGTAVASLAFASAASLTVDGGVMQVGLDGDLRCDTDGVKVEYVLETDNSTVQKLRVTDIDEKCDGAEMFIRTNLMAKQQSVTVGSTGTETFTLSPHQDAGALDSVRIWIDG